MDIQINRDKSIQLKVMLINKLELKPYREEELFKKITKRLPVVNSIRGYLIDIDLLQLAHAPL
tara:strand:- start:348 stop:536 length:189 start_codon:yes stop_codon:yes gene_type:complete